VVKPSTILFSGTLIAIGALLVGCSPASNLEQPVPNSSSEPAESAPSAEAPRFDEPTPSDVDEELDEVETTPAEEDPKLDEVASAEEKRKEEPSRDAAISWSKVRDNSTMASCWIVLKGDVYDFSQVVQQHPFGAQLSNAVCGKDATQTFKDNADINEVTKRLKPFYLGPVG
jgi:cytochrome b involved in lipid metabolism